MRRILEGHAMRSVNVNLDGRPKSKRRSAINTNHPREIQIRSISRTGRQKTNDWSVLVVYHDIFGHERLKIGFNKNCKMNVRPKDNKHVYKHAHLCY